MKQLRHITVISALPPVVGVRTNHLFMRRLKGITTIIAILLCISQTLNAQLPSWQWGKRGGSPLTASQGTPEDEMIDMATDPNGNIYVIGQDADGMPDVDGHPGLSPHDQVTVASWDCNGHFRWMKSYGGGSASGVFGIGTDSLGGVYVLGYSSSQPSAFNGPNYLDTDTILPYDNKGVYLLKYDTLGNLQWLRRPEPDNIPIGTRPPLGFMAMSVSPEGNIYLFGYIFPGTFADGAFSIISEGYYVVQYNRQGQFQQVIPMDMQTSSNDGNGGRGNMATAHFSRDNHNGRLYLAGYYSPDMGTLKFGNTTIQSVNDGFPIYLAAFSAGGTSLWSIQSDADNYGGITATSFDKNGNIYVCGGIYIDNTFNGYTSDGNQSGAPFVMAMDSSGNLLWASNAKVSANTAAVPGMLINNVYVTSGVYGKRMQWDTLIATTTSNNPNESNTYPFIARFNSETGDIISLDSMVSNTRLNSVSAMTKDANENLYIGGRFAYQLFPDNDTLTNIGGHYDWFVAKFGWENCNCEVPVPDFSASGGANFGMSFTYSGSTANSYEWDFGDGSSPGSGANPSHTYPHAGSYRVCVTASNSCGSNNTCRTITVGTTGIEDIPGFAEVSVYPNPATQMLMISGANAGTRLAIYDALGRLMLNKTLKGGKDRIDVRQLSAGIYIMRFTDKEGRRGNVKFVKE